MWRYTYFRRYSSYIVISIINNALNMLNVDVYYQILIMGLILIIVVFFDKRFNSFGIQE